MHDPLKKRKREDAWRTRGEQPKRRGRRTPVIAVVSAGALEALKQGPADTKELHRRMGVKLDLRKGTTLWTILRGMERNGLVAFTQTGETVRGTRIGTWALTSESET